MKTQYRLFQKGLTLSFLTAALVLSVGCAKKSDDGGSADPAPAALVPNTPANTDADRGTAFAAGATAALTVTLAELNSYVGTHPVNNPQDVRISVKLHQAASNQYAGDVYISYKDNGQFYNGHFATDDSQNPTGNTSTSGTKYPGWLHAAYNNWFSYNGKAVFHGFFQDSYGAILLIADQAVDLGDGQGSMEVSGSVWYKNYANSQFQGNQQSIPCWFITTGPYDCRTFLVSGNNGDGNITSPSALLPTESQFFTTKDRNPYIPEEPARGWRKLGTFSGLNKGKAFNN